MFSFKHITFKNDMKIVNFNDVRFSLFFATHSCVILQLRAILLLLHSQISNHLGFNMYCDTSFVEKIHVHVLSSDCICSY